MQPIPSHLETTLQRERIGQLTVGRHLLSVGSTLGTLITAATEHNPTIEPQLTFSFQVPRAFSGLLGRQAEIEASLAALKARQHVELCGESGIGKTTLLRHLAHHPNVTTSHADGILYLTEHQPAGDRLQTLFDIFYSTTPACRPSDREISQALADKQLLILLDDPKLSREDLQRLMDVLPESTFVIASLAQRSQGKAQVIELEGLPFAESLALMERELGRSIPSERLKAAESIWQILQGHPHRLLQTAAMLREDKASLLQVADQLEEGGERSLTRMILTTLPKTQRWIVAALVAMREVGLLSEQVAAITGPPNPQPSLQALVKRYLVQIEGHRYRLSPSLVEVLQDDFNPTPWMERVLGYLVPWAEMHRLTPEALLTERGVILHSLHWAIEKERYAEALRLVRSLEGSLLLTKQWETCQQVLQWGLQASWALEDQTSEAWALHERGTLALCQEDLTTAYDAFSQALRLRSAIADQAATTLTQHNQGQLKLLTLPALSDRRMFGGGVRVYVALGVVSLLVFGISGWLGMVISSRLNPPTINSTIDPDR
ncbi:MAG: hypothetical protein HC780_23330 [Leptolyngbyaceae cyanobacterium CSU_1_3]|nr:hypothetical protein [Leptolyngbyaceae cyanobacterium CSU_1_3]